MHPLETITITPTTSHTHTIIFLHGRGDVIKSFSNYIRLVRTSTNQTLPEALPSLKWVFPQSKARRSIDPTVSRIGNPTISQWFDIWNTQDFSDREEVQAVGLKESVSDMRQLLAAEAMALGGHWDRVILAGISQGAAVSVHTLLNLNLDSISNVQGQKGSRGLAAFLGFHCRMPFPGRSLDETRKILGLNDVPDGNEVLRNTPVLLEHNVDDPLVLLKYGHVLKDTLAGFGADVVAREYPRGGHWFNSPQGMDDAVEFIKVKVLARKEHGDSGVDARRQEDPGAMDLS